MSIFESLTLALSNLRTNKMRSALTLLGVIIGIASVITILTIGDGLREDTLSSLNNDGGVEIVAEARPIPTEEELQQAGGEEYYYYSGRLDDPSYEITSDDIDRIKDLLGDKLAGVSIGGNSSYSGELIYDRKTINGSTFFVNPYYFVQNNSQIEVGHGLTQDDIDNNKPVAVLNNKLAKQIFGDNIQAALGKEITFESDDGLSDFTVVGVLKEPKKGLLNGRGPESSSMYVPYTLESRLSDRAGTWQSVTFRTTPAAAGDLQQIKTTIADYFKPRFEGNPEYEMKVRDYTKELENVNNVLGGISAAIAGIGAISLMVGGIGVMNIMLITVTERTREIGIRKALGATRKDIRRQFVIEAMVVCLIGGFIGMAIGAVLGPLVCQLMFQTMTMPPIMGMIGSLMFCLVIGLFFGWYPAGRAGKLDPIEALRYE